MVTVTGNVCPGFGTLLSPCFSCRRLDFAIELALTSGFLVLDGAAWVELFPILLKLNESLVLNLVPGEAETNENLHVYVILLVKTIKLVL